MVRKVSAEDVRNNINSNVPSVLIDVLTADSYAKQHLPEAINIPIENENEFENRIRAEIPDKNSPIIAYCASETCEASPKASKKLESMGYTNVSHYPGGLKGWKEAGYEFESGGTGAGNMPSVEEANVEPQRRRGRVVEEPARRKPVMPGP